MNKNCAEYWFLFWDSPTGKGIKEALRWAVLGFFSLLIDGLIENFTKMETPPEAMPLILLALRFIDSMLHKSGVAERGITRF